MVRVARLASLIAPCVLLIACHGASPSDGDSESSTSEGAMCPTPEQLEKTAEEANVGGEVGCPLPDPPHTPGPGGATGMFNCEGVSHRAFEGVCDAPAAARDEACSEPWDGDECQVDADCTAGSFGTCTQTFLNAATDGCACEYGCRCDADCPGGMVCAGCVCMPGACAIDADCGEYACAVSDSFWNGRALACMGPDDECRTDADCEDCNECVFDDDEGHWACDWACGD